MKLTKKHFEYFKERCKYWQVKFGLIDCHIYYEFKYDKEIRGSCTASYTNRIATILLSTDMDCAPHEVNKFVDHTAFHEVMELFLSQLKACAYDRVWDMDIYLREEHAVIRVLENVVFEKERDNK